MSKARVAVITTSLEDGSNDIWHALRPHLGELIVIGATPQSGTTVGVGEVALQAFDAGRGLVWRHLAGLRRTLTAFRPDLVHVNGELWGITAQELVGRRGRIVVHGAENLWNHGGRLEQALRMRLVARAVRRMAGYASWNHAGAAHIRELRQRQGGPALPTVVLPGIIPPAPFRASPWQRPPLTSELRPLRVLLVGRVVAAKGFDTAIEAAAQLPEGQVTVDICGAGEALADLQALARDRRVPLERHGQLSAADLAEVMRASHVLVQPSRTTPEWAEQFGRSVAEAMVLGLPVLVSSSGELPHLVGGDERAVFREGDSAHLASMLAPLLDPRALSNLSAAQQFGAARYSPERTVPEVLDFWAASMSGA